MLQKTLSRIPPFFLSERPIFFHKILDENRPEKLGESHSGSNSGFGW